MKHYQLTSTTNRILIFIILFLWLIMLSFLLISANSFKETKPIKTKTIAMLDLYKPVLDDSTFLIRWDINKYIIDNPTKIIEFYSYYTNNDKISSAIIRNALEHTVPINIAFAVVYHESRFNPKAYNNNGSSADRGLFQLNDSYRNWPKSEFYNIELNTHEGTKYLNEMIILNKGDIIYALYCYNAGPTRIRSGGIIPSTTKKYVNKILEFEDMLNQDFNKWIDQGA